jgi:Tripartite tricarboxylate transporter family receptor
LAVTTATRSKALPEIPTVADFVPGYEASAFVGIGVPQNTPAEIVDKLNREINAGLANPKLTAQFADLGGTPLPGTPADFGELIAAETEKWGKVVFHNWGSATRRQWTTRAAKITIARASSRNGGLRRPFRRCRARRRNITRCSTAPAKVSYTPPWRA